MGGQACVLYGGAEFSRDTDFAVLADPANLGRLRRALAELKARCIAIPPFEARHLRRGHAVHFRCGASGCHGLRVDLMAKMRGLPAFPVLWKRRQTWQLGARLQVEGLALPDLVRAKKTQRDKDWPMIRRLIEADYFACANRPRPGQVRFWLREARSPEILREMAQRFPAQFQLEMKKRKLRGMGKASLLGWEKALRREEDAERARDRVYWRPLRQELEELRRKGLPGNQDAVARSK
jgi:hypothetical protein